MSEPRWLQLSSTEIQLCSLDDQECLGRCLLQLTIPYRDEETDEQYRVRIETIQRSLNPTDSLYGVGMGGKVIPIA